MSPDTFSIRRNVFLLALCQALWVSANSLMITTTALVGVALTENKALATLPYGFVFLAAMLTSYPASMLMGRIGRKAGFLLALVVGLIGAGICVLAIIAKSFIGFCFGTFMLGILNGFAMYYRFAAADVASEAFRSRAISYVLAGGVIAAFIGPNMANFTKDVFPGALFAGGYLSIMLFYVLSIFVMSCVRFPPQVQTSVSNVVKPLKDIIRKPQFILAVTGAVVSYGSMNLLMSATPLAMQGHGHLFSETAFVIQWHILGMFVPSFFTGHLLRRFGDFSVMFAGALLLLICVAVNLAGITLVHFWLALVLLGLGWNFLFVGATTLLTEICDDSEKAKVQGANDLIVMTVVGVTAFSSGMLHHLIGWEWMNLTVVPFIILVMFGLLWLRRELAALVLAKSYDG